MITILIGVDKHGKKITGRRRSMDQTIEAEKTTFGRR